MTMVRILCWLLFLTFAHLTVGQYDEAATYFLNKKMANFSTWITVNHLDPYPMQHKELGFNAVNDLVDINCTLTANSVQGHSREITIQYLGFDDSLIHYDFGVEFDMLGNITFFGNYTLNGTVDSFKPISSTGIWKITVPIVNFAFQTVLSPGDYVTIKSFHLPWQHLNDSTGYDIYFENLLDQDNASGYEQHIQGALFNGFAKQMTLIREDPIRIMYMDYWNHVFQNVTREEFHGLDRSTTTESYTTTTQLPTTSANPNECPPSGTDLVAHPTSCSLYFVCVDGTAFEQECSEGLHFNPIVKECDVPENINCTKPLPECPAEGVTFHPYPGNCSLYVICAEGTPLVRHCVEGTCFNLEELKCRVNDTVAYDIPRRASSHDVSNFHENVLKCEREKNQGIILINGGRTSKEFSLCDNGNYIATFTCPSYHVFDIQAQDCVKEDI